MDLLQIYGNLKECVTHQKIHMKLQVHLEYCPNGNSVGEDYLLVFDTFTFHPCHACNQFHEWPNLKNDVKLREMYQ